MFLMVSEHTWLCLGIFKGVSNNEKYNNFYTIKNALSECTHNMQIPSYVRVYQVMNAWWLVLIVSSEDIPILFFDKQLISTDHIKYSKNIGNLIIFPYD